MAEGQIVIQVIADGSAAEAGLSKTADGMKKVQTAGQQLQSGFKSLQAVAGALGITLGAAMVVRALKQFVTEAVEAATQTENFRNALNAALPVGTSYAEAMDQVGAATRGMMAEWEMASATNSMLATGIAKTTEEAAQLIDAGIVLTTVFKANGASMDRYIRLLQNGSKFLFDNFGMSMRLVDINTQLIMTNTGLSREEAKLQAIREYAIKHGKRYRNSIGELAKTQRQLNSATTDFKSAVGTALKPALVESRREATYLIRKLEDLVDALNDYRDANKEASERATELLKVWTILMPIFGGGVQTVSTISFILDKLGAGTKLAAEGYEGLGHQAEAFRKYAAVQIPVVKELTYHMQFLEDRMTDTRKTFQDSWEDIRTWSYIAVESFGEVEQAGTNYITSLGTGFIAMGQMQTDSATSTGQYYSDLATIQSDALVDRETLEAAHTENLAKIEADRQAAIDYVRTGAWNRTVEQELIEEKWHNDFYDRATEAEIAAYEARLGVINEKEAEKKRVLATARAEQLAADKKAYAHLLLQLSLTAIEAKGILLELPGYGKVSVEQMVVAIESGLFPISPAFSKMLGTTQAQLAGSFEGSQIIAAKNISDIETDFTNALNNKMTPAITDMGIESDTTFTDMGIAVLGVRDDSLTPLDDALVNLNENTLRRTKESSKTTTDDMGTKWNDLLSLSIVPLNAGLISPDTGTVGALGAVKDKSKIMKDDMEKDLDAIIKKIKDEGGLISTFKDAVIELVNIKNKGGEATTAIGQMWTSNEDHLGNLENAFEDLTDELEDMAKAARDAAKAIDDIEYDGGGGGGGGQQVYDPLTGNWRQKYYQHGADFIVPPGYSNDSYPMRVGTGEHVQVTPRGQLGNAGRAMTVNIQGNWSPETEQDMMRFTKMLAMLG